MPGWKNYYDHGRIVAFNGSVYVQVSDWTSQGMTDTGATGMETDTMDTETTGTETMACRAA